jgi:hypothetical protein
MKIQLGVRTLLFVLGLMLISSVLKAQITVRDWREDKLGRYLITPPEDSFKSGMKLYIKGIGDGIQVAASGTAYCPPKNLGLGTQNFLDIIDREIEHILATWGATASGKETLDKMWVSIVLFEGLKETFPCTQGDAR